MSGSQSAFNKEFSMTLMQQSRSSLINVKYKTATSCGFILIKKKTQLNKNSIYLFGNIQNTSVCNSQKTKDKRQEYIK